MKSTGLNWSKKDTPKKTRRRGEALLTRIPKMHMFYQIMKRKKIVLETRHII